MTSADPSSLLEAETQLFSRCGLRPQVRTVRLPEPFLKTRVFVSGTGPPVVLLHGGAGTAPLWAPLMARLLDHTVYAMDRPGSDGGAAFDYQGQDVRAHATLFLESVLDALELPAAPVVGSSLGGLWSFWFAAARPQRISALAQMGPPAMLFGTRNSVGLVLGVGTHLSGPVARKRAGSMVRLAGGRIAVTAGPPEVEEYLHQAEQQVASVQTRASLLAALWRLREQDPTLGLGQDVLARLDVPVLFVWGTNDWYGSLRAAERACRAVPDATLRVVRAGHLPWVDRPAESADALREFLASRAIGSSGPGAVRPGPAVGTGLQR